MTLAILAWQLLIVITIVASGKRRGIASLLWSLWTLVQVSALPLSVLQFITIFITYKLTSPSTIDEGKPQTTQPEVNLEPKFENKKATSSNVRIIPRPNNAIAAVHVPLEINSTISSSEPIARTTFSSMLASKSSTEKATGVIKNKIENPIAYVTKYNFKKILAHSIVLDEEVPIDKIFSLIYDMSLSEILNHQEARSLYNQKIMLDGSINSYSIKYYTKNSNYIFKVSNPKYHHDNDCKFLQSDFVNYLVPPAIKALGDEKVKEFQSYCESHKKDLSGKPDDIFWFRVGVKFKVHINPHEVHYINSGIEEVKGMTVAELQTHINSCIGSILSSLLDNNSLTKYRYARNVNTALSQVSDEDIKPRVADFFNKKSNLINALFELYAKEANNNGYILPVKVLNACNLEPCKVCYT